MNKNLIIIFLSFFIIITLFTIAALIPRNLVNYTPPGGDDLVHVYIYLILSLLLCISKTMHVKYVCLIIFSHSFLIEILQFIVGRNFSYIDILYNCVGISLGISIYFCINKIILSIRKF